MNYFERTLAHLRLFGNTHAFGLTMPTKANAQTWIDRIENELSPENLTCDGELPRAQVRRKAQELNTALAHCRLLLGQTADPFGIAYGVAIRDARRQRTQDRANRLRESIVQDGKTVGALVLLKNGVRGKIVQINRTRFRVEGNDGRTWMVPPSCCIVLEKAK